MVHLSSNHSQRLRIPQGCWGRIENAPTQGVAQANYFYQGNLPNSLLGANQIYIQTQLNTSGLNILAQLGRYDTKGGDVHDIFDLNANYTTAVPENSTLSLFGIGFAILAFTSKSFKRIVL
jgi:hypothetical protein